MAKKPQIEEIAVKDIFADPNNPRRDFSAPALGRLKNSIEQKGIRNPIIVMKTKDGYQLIDGERRFRAVQELGLKTVPAIVEDKMSAAEILVLQFNLQNLHESWNTSENAIAFIRLADLLKVSYIEAARQAGIAERTAANYAVWANMPARASMEKYSVPPSFARNIHSLTSKAKRVMAKEEESFSKLDEQRFQESLIEKINSHELNDPKDFIKLGDSFTAQPSLVKKIIERKITKDIDEIFVESRAKVAYVNRNLLNNARFLVTAVNQSLKLKGDLLLKDNPQVIRDLKNVIKAAEEMLGRIE